MSHSRGTEPCCGKTAARPRITRPLHNARSTEATFDPRFPSSFRNSRRVQSIGTGAPSLTKMSAAAPPTCPTTKPPSNGSTWKRTIRFPAPRPSNQVPGGVSIVPRRYWIALLFTVPIGRVANASYFQTDNSGVNRIPPPANTTVDAVMSSARARTTPSGVCSRTASACQWTFLTGVDSEMSIPAPNPSTKLPNPRGNR